MYVRLMYDWHIIVVSYIREKSFVYDICDHLYNIKLGNQIIIICIFK